MHAIRRIRAVVRKEAKALLRDRFYLLIAVGLPVLTMITMGYGINYDVKGLPLGVADLDRSAESRALVDAFVASDYFRLALVAREPDALDHAMLAGRIRAAVVIPSGFSRMLYRGMLAEAQILVDGSFPTRAEIARNYATAILSRFNQDRLEALAVRVPVETGVPDLDVVARIWFNPTLESKNFQVPALLVLSLLFWAPVLASLSVTREKETGAILNVQTVPLARWEYIAGKLIPYTGISFASYWLLMLASVFLFQVPIKGSLAVLTLGALIFVASMTGLGLLVSALVRTQVTALVGTAVIVMAVGLFYSGWLEPISTLDARGRFMSRLLPTADFVILARGVFLKGLGFATYWAALGKLAIYATAYVLLAVLAFRKRRR